LKNKILKLICFGVFFNTALFGACACCGNASCASVNMGIITATDSSKSAVQTQDDILGDLWKSEIQPVLLEVEKTEKTIMTYRKGMKNLKEAELILNAKENYYAFLTNKMLQSEFDTLTTENKLLELENEIDLAMLKLKLDETQSKQVKKLGAKK